MSCTMFELLNRVPFPGLRLRLSRWHVDRCPRCHRESEGSKTLSPLLVTAGQLPPGLDLWPGVRKEITDRRQPAAAGTPAPLAARRSWRWAYAVVMLLMAVVVGLWALFLGRGLTPHLGPVSPLSAPQTRLCSARVADRPARVFQFQSRDPNRSIFWIAKEIPRS